MIRNQVSSIFGNVCYLGWGQGGQEILVMQNHVTKGGWGGQANLVLVTLVLAFADLADEPSLTKCKEILKSFNPIIGVYIKN